MKKSPRKKAQPPYNIPRRQKPRHRPWTLATATGTASLFLPSLSLLHLWALNGSLLPLTYVCGLSSVTFLLYGYDKMQARNVQWRVREVTLHVLAAAGGWPGAMVGMHYFQHKTRKRRFQVWFWLIVGGWQIIAWESWMGKI